jgi:hypothetical protein
VLHLQIQLTLEAVAVEWFSVYQALDLEELEDLEAEELVLLEILLDHLELMV